MGAVHAMGRNCCIFGYSRFVCNFSCILDIDYESCFCVQILVEFYEANSWYGSGPIDLCCGRIGSNDFPGGCLVIARRVNILRHKHLL